jgi:hypothetical protein
MTILSKSPCSNYVLMTRQKSYHENAIVLADKRSRSEIVLDTVDYEKLYEVPLWVYWRRNAVIYGSFVIPTVAYDYLRRDYSVIEDVEYSYDHGVLGGLPVRRRNQWYISPIDVHERAKAWLENNKK